MAATTRRTRGWVATNTTPSCKSRKGAMRLSRPARRRWAGRSCPRMAMVEMMAAEIRKVPESAMNARPSAVPGSRPPERDLGAPGGQQQEEEGPHGEGAVGRAQREAVGLDQLVALHQVGDAGLPGRLEDQGQPFHGEVDQHQRGDGAGEDQAEHQHRPAHFDGDHGVLAIDPVGDHPAHGREEEAGEDARHQGEHDAAAPGEVVGQGEGGEDGHPVAGAADQARLPQPREGARLHQGPGAAGSRLGHGESVSEAADPASAAGRALRPAAPGLPPPCRAWPPCPRRPGARGARPAARGPAPA